MRKMISAAGCCALVLSASLAWGFPGDSENPGGSGNSGQQGESTSRPPHPLLAMFDANHDGVLTSDEIEKVVSFLKSLDKNQDGKITLDELPRPPRDGQQGQGNQSRPGEGQGTSGGAGQGGTGEGVSPSGPGTSGGQFGPPAGGTSGSNPPTGGQSGISASNPKGSQGEGQTGGKSAGGQFGGGQFGGGQTGTGGGQFGGSPSGKGKVGGRGRTGGTGSGSGTTGRGKPVSKDIVQKLFQYDTDKDGKLTEMELPTKYKSLVATWDANGDGSLDFLEVQKLCQELGPGYDVPSKSGGPSSGSSSKIEKF